MWATEEAIAAQRVYAWEHRWLYQRFPSPLSLKASRHVIAELCEDFGVPAPRVRPLWGEKLLPCNVSGAYNPEVRTIYLRGWPNKAVVLHEFAHYLSHVHGDMMGHGEEFMNRYIRVLFHAGVALDPDVMARHRLAFDYGLLVDKYAYA